MPISLFYCYIDVTDPVKLADKLRSFGETHELAGRIRISFGGVNGTFGGCQETLYGFHALLLQELGNPDIDFKVSDGSADNFPGGWVVRVCKELVTLGVAGADSLWRQAAPHVSPKQFREEVLDGKAVILDVRNRYEHAIGRFNGAVLPPIRQFSDFPKFVRENKHLFQDRRVLMYCTGGIRCETASALVKEMGVTSSVAQLQGGIDRFLSTYPDGGRAWSGKNLVFDARMAVPTSPPTVVGRCIVCNSFWDDYSRNSRCTRCRARILLCNDSNCSEQFYGLKSGVCMSCEQGRGRFDFQI